METVCSSETSKCQPSKKQSSQTQLAVSFYWFISLLFDPQYWVSVIFRNVGLYGVTTHKTAVFNSPCRGILRSSIQVSLLCERSCQVDNWPSAALFKRDAERQCSRCAFGRSLVQMLARTPGILRFPVLRPPFQLIVHV
jgi:hypothetical protein